MDRTVLVFGLFILYTAFCQAVKTPQAQLVSDLMADYNRNLVPQYDPNQQMKVTVTFGLKSIESLDEKNQILNSFGYIGFSWQDELLRWDPAAYGGATFFVIPGSQIWLPEVAMYNSVDSGNDLALDIKFRAKVFANGQVFWAPGFKWRTNCQVKLTDFPYDSQTCSIKLVNWMYSKPYLDYIVDTNIMISLYETNGVWKLSNVSSYSAVLDTNDIISPMAVLQIDLTRIPSYYELNVLVPCIMISLLSALVFYLPTESGEKVSLAITVSLSYTVILLMVSDISPKSGESMPLISLLIIIGMGQTFLFLFLTVIVLCIYHHCPNTPVPHYMRVCIFDCLAVLVCMKCGDSRRVSPSKANFSANNDMLVDDLDNQIMQKAKALAAPPDALLPDDVLTYLRGKMEDDSEEERKDKNCQEWAWVSKVLDRFFLIFFVFLIIAEGFFFVYVTKTGLSSTFVP